MNISPDQQLINPPWRIDEFINAARDGDLEAVKDVLSSGANTHAIDDCALLLASNNGHLEIVQCLISSGADVHAKNNDVPLRLASNNGHLGVVQCLLDHGAKPSKPTKDQWLANALQGTNLDWLELYLSTFKRRTQATALEILKANAICGAYALCWAKGDI